MVVPLSRAFVILAFGIAASSFVFGLLPGGIFVTLRLSGIINWKVPAHGTWPEKALSSIRLMLMSWLGSFLGVILAIVSFFAADYWDYLRYPDRVRDGQGVLVLIFSVPVCGLLAGVLVVVGYRLCLCSPTERLWSAPWLYSGSKRIANMSVASAVPVALLGCVFLCGFLINWVLVHPGPF